MKKDEKKFEKIIDLAMRKALFFPTAEIYASSMAGFWEYGPYGHQLKNNLITMWRKHLLRPMDSLEIDGCNILPQEVFIASGHLKSFADPISKCKKCGSINRVDKLIEEKTGVEMPEAMSNEKFNKAISKYKIKCPVCKGELEGTQKFNLMLKTSVGPEKDNTAYLRPEACQSIFLDFHRVYKTMRRKLPLPIAQFQRAYRNEISPRKSLFRLREFYQKDVETFFNPKKINEVLEWDKVKNIKMRLQTIKDKKPKELTAVEAMKKKIFSGKLIAYYMALSQKYYEALGLKPEKIRFRQLGDDEKAFYAKEAWDTEVMTSIGWVEITANNYRTGHDLGEHAKVSKKDLRITEDGEKFTPHIWEMSMGVDRLLICILDEAYTEEKVDKEERVVLKLVPEMAPITIAVFPLMKKDGLQEKAREVQDLLQKDYEAVYDETGSIGKRYRRMDELGTPLCITIDYQTLKDNTVTIRDRDSMKQLRVKINELNDFAEIALEGKVKFNK